MLNFALALLFQAPEADSGKTNIIRIAAGALALICIVGLILRRKKKASKEEW